MNQSVDEAFSPNYQLVAQRVARQLIYRYDWTLLSEVELTAQIIANITADTSAVVIQQTALNLYTIALYKACRQQEDRARCEQGYRELHRFLLRSASKWRPEQDRQLLEEAAQRAIVLVFEQLERCRIPAGFLAFVLYKLKQAFTELAREAQKHIESLEAETADTHLATSETNRGLPHEQQTELQSLLHEALVALPDARMQQEFRLKFVEGWSDQEIGQQLGITANHVRVLRNRGLTLMRQDQRLTIYLTETS